MSPSPQPQTTGVNSRRLLTKQELAAQQAGNFSVTGAPSTPQDPYAGVQIKAQPGILDKAAQFTKKYLYDPNTPIDPSFGAMEMMQAIPPVAGMVMNPKNAAKVAEGVTKFKPGATVLEQLYDPFGDALGYMTKKYPTLMGRVQSLRELPAGSGSAMRTIPTVKNGKIVRMGDMRIESGLGFENTVRDMAHELVHLYQERHKPILDYIQPDTDFDKYWNQAYEVNARRGENTGLSTVESFKRALKEHRASQLPQKVLDPAVHEAPPAPNWKPPTPAQVANPMQDQGYRQWIDRIRQMIYPNSL